MSNRNKSRLVRGRRAPSRDRSACDIFQNALAGDQFQQSRSFDPRTDRKTLQLCRQVQRALMLALAGECNDDLLRQVSIDSVQPGGSAGHLLVRVTIPVGLTVPQVLFRLDERSAKLRAIVASSICRKRALMLSFVPIPPGPQQEEVAHD